MFEMGIVVGLALLVSLSKMSWPWKLRVLSSPFLMDALIFLGLLILHWGSFSGVMVATIGAFMCSLLLSAGRFFFGYLKNGQYIPGRFDIGHKLAK